MLHQPCLEFEPQNVVVILAWTFSFISILPKISMGWSASVGRVGAIKFAKDASCDEHNNPIP